MRHKLQGKKLNRTTSHRKAMLANMASSLILHEQVKTTVPKAKTLRPFVEKLVTLAKKGDLASRRRIIAKVRDEAAADKLIATLGPRYAKRPGGYTRIMRAGFRFGDMAPVAYIEFVERDVEAKGAEDIAAHKEALASQHSQETVE